MAHEKNLFILPLPSYSSDRSKLGVHVQRVSLAQFALRLRTEVKLRETNRVSYSQTSLVVA